jgi:hypothetical protein
MGLDAVVKKRRRRGRVVGVMRRRNYPGRGAEEVVPSVGDSGEGEFGRHWRWDKTRSG